MRIGLGLHITRGGGAVEPPTPAAPANTALPVISGDEFVGETLSVTTGTWTGFPAPTFTYQWQNATVNIGGATSDTYVLQGTDEGDTITCEVTGTNSEGSAMAESVSTGAIGAALAAPVNTVLPVISGTTESGETLTATTGTWTGNPTPTYTYQWTAATVDIGGATSSTYVLQVSDEGDNIAVKVTGTNSEGSAVATAASVGPVTAPGGGGYTGTAITAENGDVLTTESGDVLITG